jgi:hypothetical protein
MKDFKAMITNGFRLKLFFLKSMPMGFLAGLKVDEIDDEKASVSVPFNYLTKNPFRSVYFAVQAMAAELSSGVIAMSEVMKAPVRVSMLVLESQAVFTKKAVSRLTFTCRDAKAIADAVAAAVETGEGQTVTVTSTGVDNQGDTVSEFRFTWTFKAK